jgi:hypothetical protein
MRARASFWASGAILTAVMAFTTVQTPLYGLYQQKLGFPTIVLTLIFSVFAVGVAAGLWLLGHVSDSVGRRPMILVGLALQLPALVIDLQDPGVAGLLIARVVSGVGVGALTAAATAQLDELRALAAPREGRRLLDAVSSLANVGGLALGPLLAGILATFAPFPLATSYLVFVVLLAAGFAVAWFIPETVPAPRGETPYRLQAFSFEPAVRGRLIAAGAAAFAAFATFGMFASVSPNFIAGELHNTSLLVAGVVTFSVFASAAIVPIVFGGAALRSQLLVAKALGLIGLTVIVIAVWAVSLALFVAGGILAGAGAGVLFARALGVAATLGDGATRGQMISVVFLFGYAGLTIPVVVIGIVLEYLTAAQTLTGFAVVIAAVLLAASGALLSEQPRLSGMPAER